MRTLLLITVMLTAVMFSISDAQAFEVKGKWTISPFGGVAIPIGDLGDNKYSNPEAGAANIGYSIGESVEFGVTEQILIGGRFAYDRFGIDQEIICKTCTITDDFDAHWSVTEFLGLYGKALLLPGRSTRPYVRGGLFLGKPDLHIDGSFGAWSGVYDVSFGLESALGVTHMISSHVGIGVEARFAHLITNESAGRSEVEKARSAQVSAPSGVRDPGGNLDWLAANAYLTFGIGN